MLKKKLAEDSISLQDTNNISEPHLKGEGYTWLAVSCPLDRDLKGRQLTATKTPKPSNHAGSRSKSTRGSLFKLFVPSM